MGDMIQSPNHPFNTRWQRYQTTNCQSRAGGAQPTWTIAILTLTGRGWQPF
jgi:hypothetical protein